MTSTVRNNSSCLEHIFRYVWDCLHIQEYYKMIFCSETLSHNIMWNQLKPFPFMECWFLFSLNLWKEEMKNIFHGHGLEESTYIFIKDILSKAKM